MAAAPQVEDENAGLQAQLARGLAEVDPNVSPAGSPQVEVLTRQQIKSQVQSQVLLHTGAKEAYVLVHNDVDRESADKLAHDWVIHE